MNDLTELKSKLLNKDWRVNHLYFIVDKNSKRIRFKRNRAQADFNIKKTNKNIVLKSRQLGFTTDECIDILDDVLFNPNYSALFIAHTKEDATEIFDKKILFAWQNFDKDLSSLWQVDAEAANKLKFGFGDDTFSSVVVANSGRSATNNRVHVSEFAKLCAKYPAKADEVISGTFPSVPLGGRTDIESTAEGMTGHFYEMFMDAWNRKRPAQPTEFTAHFYNWTWDDEEISKIDKVIPFDEMDESKRFKEYQIIYNLSDIQITYYYSKWLSLNKDWDKLHQEYPTTPEEAFIASGNTFFNKERIVSCLTKCLAPLTLEPIELPKDLLNHYVDGNLRVFTKPEEFASYVLAADVSEGKEGDSSTCVIINNRTLKTVAKFGSNKIRPDEFAELLNNVGRWYNNAYLGVESNTGLWVLTELYERWKYPNLYWREAEDDVTHRVGKQLGFSTTGKSRKPLLDNLLVQVNLYDNIWHTDFLKECLTFIKNEQGRPEAAEGKHDDEIIAMAICHYIRENAPSEHPRPVGEPRTIEERIMARLEAKKHKHTNINQLNYL